MTSEIQPTINELLILRLDTHADWLKHIGNELGTINDRIDHLEEQIRRLKNRIDKCQFLQSEP